MPKSIVYLVDDDEGIRISMKALLDMEGFNTRLYANGKELLADVDRMTHGCLIVDFKMPEMSGLELVREVRSRGCDLPFLLISGCATISMAVEAMKLGAVNIIEKPFEPIDFLAYVHATIDEDRKHHVQVDEATRNDPRSMLTPREKEVLELVVAGELTKNIARHLGISTKTVEVHRSNITKKFRVDSVAQLVSKVLLLDTHSTKNRGISALHSDPS